MSKQTEVITIDGMSCQHCVSAVKNALTSTEGVYVDSVSIGAAIVSYETDSDVRDRIRQAIEDAGFSVREMNAADEAI